LAAKFGGRWLDKIFSAVAIAGVSLPHYWVAIVLVMIFSATLNLLPAQGMSTEGSFTSLNGLSFLILPITTLALVPMGVTARMTRAAALEVLSQDFVGALDGRGLSSRRITLHVIKNAAPSVIAIMGLQFGYLVGGSILVETVFNWPGSGNLLNLAIFRRDIPIVQGTILLLALIFVGINLVVDIIQAIIDPRMRR
jgi:peptide/nickel transport system permease protein